LWSEDIDKDKDFWSEDKDKDLTSEDKDKKRQGQGKELEIRGQGLCLRTTTMVPPGDIISLPLNLNVIKN